MADTDFSIEFSDFNEGLAPIAHIDDKTFLGNKGQASTMRADVISNPGFLQQSPGLSDLTNGSQAGVVDQLIRTILDKPVDSSTTFGVGTTKFFKITPTTVVSGGTPSWPQTITNMTAGESAIRLKKHLYVFYNRSSDGDIAAMPLDELYKIRSPETAANDNSYGNEAWAGVSGTLSEGVEELGDGDLAAFEPSTTDPSQYLKITNFGFDIPSTATIQGIKVEINKFNDPGAGGDITDERVRIVKGGTIGVTDRAESDNWPTSPQYVTHGSSTDLWGTTWAYTDINASDFGVAISVSVSETGPIANIDHVRITVYYTDASTDGELIETWGSSADQALENALHPSATKEDIMVFGNGRYLGVYVEGSSILDVQKLDFGEGAEIADVVFHSNLWWIAVNYGEGRRGQIYLYDGSAISNILSDEAGLGSQKIGFLYVLNGIVYVAYQDNSSGAFTVGWLSGRQIKPLRYFSGTLPDHRQKTLYKNTILFASSGDAWTVGASVEQLPIQVSTLADGGHSTLGAIAAPFGTPMIASTDGGTNHRLAKFSGLSTTSNWKSVFVDLTKERMLGKVHTVIVATKALGSDAQADITLEGNQGAETSTAVEVTGENSTRHVFRTIDLVPVEDVRVSVDYSNGDTTNNCPIRKIILLGNFVER
jgi:hypothetical protein